MTEIRNTTTLVGLFRWPEGESLSPKMQNAGFAALGLDWAYVPLPTAPERLGDAVRGIAAAGFAGANVTMPHKQAAVELCDEVDEIAARAGSVNTLVFRDGRIEGSSTDGDAVTSQVEAGGNRALVLGAGGAALAVVEALERAGADVVVTSRREPAWPPEPGDYDILVNATPVKDHAIVTPRAGQQVVDLTYYPDGRETALVAAARKAGCDVIVEGLDVLLFQGAASFERWTGLPAPLVAMRGALRGDA